MTAYGQFFLCIIENEKFRKLTESCNNWNNDQIQQQQLQPK